MKSEKNTSEEPELLPDLAESLRKLLGEYHPKLIRLPETDAHERPAPDKWSRSEIIGHLIDSAANNHARFVIAQTQDSLIFPGYDQEAWVENQYYRQTDWTALVTLWTSYNHHIAHVMEHTPPDTLLRPRKEHDFARMTHGYTDDEAPDSLYHLMKDYIGHLEHHLRQLNLL